MLTILFDCGLIAIALIFIGGMIQTVESRFALSVAVAADPSGRVVAIATESDAEMWRRYFQDKYEEVLEDWAEI